MEEDKLTIEDFSCSCCYDVMLDPTTLNCGHNFCRFCLAQWWKSSSQTTCPECRHEWPGFPKINITLRKTIERLFKDQLDRRVQALAQNKMYDEIIAKFEEFGRSRNENLRSGGRRNHFYTVAAVIVGVVVMMTLGTRSYWGGSYSVLTTKLVQEWTAEDVMMWVGGLGNWASSTYDIRFKEAGIDGNLLMRMTEQDLMAHPINMNIQLQRRVFMSALHVLRTQGQKPPSDFFEYKAANRALSMMMLFGLREFPRATVSYLYLFHYKDIFLPFVHHSCPPAEHHPLSPSDMSTLSEPPTWSQASSFLIRLVLCPYYLLGLFAYDFLDVNFWTARIVILHAVLMTLYELSNIKWLLTRGFSSLPKMVVKCALFAVGNAAFHKVIWPVIPFFICDCVFYWLLYISPFDALNRWWQRMNNPAQDRQQRTVNQQNNQQQQQQQGWNMNFEWNYEAR